MSIWHSIFNWLGEDASASIIFSSDACSNDLFDTSCHINPACGLPMVGDCGGVDVAGNLYGTDSSINDFTSTSMFDDGFSSSCTSSWGDSFSSTTWDE